MTLAVIGHQGRGGAGAVLPVVEIWRRRASSCGGSNGSDRGDGARSEGAQVRRQAAAVVWASAEQQIVGSVALIGRKKELSRSWSGLAEEESSRSVSGVARRWRCGR